MYIYTNRKTYCTVSQLMVHDAGHYAYKIKDKHLKLKLWGRYEFCAYVCTRTETEKLTCAPEFNFKCFSFILI